MCCCGAGRASLGLRGAPRAARPISQLHVQGRCPQSPDCTKRGFFQRVCAVLHLQGPCPGDGAAPGVTPVLVGSGGSSDNPAVTSRSVPVCVTRAPKDGVCQGTASHGENSWERRYPQADSRTVFAQRILEPRTRGGRACGNITSVISAGSRCGGCGSACSTRLGAAQLGTPRACTPKPAYRACTPNSAPQICPPEPAPQTLHPEPAPQTLCPKPCTQTPHPKPAPQTLPELPSMFFVSILHCPHVWGTHSPSQSFVGLLGDPLSSPHPFEPQFLSTPL